MESIKEFNNSECPFVYPIHVNNKDELRRYLIDHRIYCAVHWPFDGIGLKMRQQAVLNAQTLISLPIDHRYGLKEFSYMMEVLSQFGGDLLF